MDPDGYLTNTCEDSLTPDIELHEATTFNDILGIDETIQILTLWIGESSGLLGATMAVSFLEDPSQIETNNPTTGGVNRG